METELHSIKRIFDYTKCVLSVKCRRCPDIQWLWAGLGGRLVMGKWGKMAEAKVNKSGHVKHPGHDNYQSYKDSRLAIEASAFRARNISARILKQQRKTTATHRKIKHGIRHRMVVEKSENKTTNGVRKIEILNRNFSHFKNWLEALATFCWAAAHVKSEGERRKLGKGNRPDGQDILKDMRESRGDLGWIPSGQQNSTCCMLRTALAQVARIFQYCFVDGQVFSVCHCHCFVVEYRGSQGGPRGMKLGQFS